MYPAVLSGLIVLLLTPTVGASELFFRLNGSSFTINTLRRTELGRGAKRAESALEEQLDGAYDRLADVMALDAVQAAIVEGRLDRLPAVNVCIQEERPLHSSARGAYANFTHFRPESTTVTFDSRSLVLTARRLVVVERGVLFQTYRQVWLMPRGVRPLGMRVQLLDPRARIINPGELTVLHSACFIVHLDLTTEPAICQTAPFWFAVLAVLLIAGLYVSDYALKYLSNLWAKYEKKSKIAPRGPS